MGIYDADTLPVDDDTFLNGGTPPEPKTEPTITRSSAPLAEKPASEPAQKPEPEHMDPEDEFAANAIEPEPLALETREVSLEPSAEFEADMKKNAKEVPETNIGDDTTLPTPTPTSMMGTQKNPYDELAHVSGVTPSQAMIPDGVLNKNRVRLDGEEDEEEEQKHETMIPSQAMVETFANEPLKIPALEEAAEQAAEEAAEEEEFDDTPVVVGPVISSAGMESLTEEQAENPENEVKAEAMTMKAKVDEDAAEAPKEEPAKPEEKPAEPVPSEPVPSPAPEPVPESETKSEETKPVEEATPTEGPKPEEEPKPEEKKEELPVLRVVNSSAPVGMDAPEPVPALEPVPANTTTTVAPGKNTHPMVFILVAIVLVVLIGLVIFGVSAMMHGDDGGTDDDGEDKVGNAVFFLPSNDGYLLFNEAGEQLSEKPVMAYSTNGMNFYNNDTVLVVEKSTNKPGIMNKDGQMVVPFGTYSDIIPSGQIYYGINKDKTDIIIGDKTITGEKVIGFGMSNSNYSKNGAIFAIKDYSIHVYNGQGKNIFDFDCMKNTDGKCLEASPVVRLWNTSGYDGDTTDDKISFHYNKKAYVLDANTGEVLATFSSDKSFLLDNYVERTKTFVFKSGNEYKFIVDKKEKSPTRACSNVEKRIAAEKELLFCQANDGKYALRDDLSFGVKEVSRTRMILDATTYAERTNNTLKFYKNDKLVKTLNGTFEFSFDTVSHNNYYLITTTCPNNKCTGMSSSAYMTFYTDAGEKMINEDFITATDFDAKTGAAIVVDSNSKQHLINKSGKKISNDYADIELISIGDDDWYYLAYNSSRRKNELLDKNGNIVSEDVGYVFQIYNGKLCHTNAKSTAVIVDGEQVYEKKSIEQDILLKKYYIDVLNFETMEHEYYSYSGKLIYSYIEK